MMGSFLTAKWLQEEKIKLSLPLNSPGDSKHLGLLANSAQHAVLLHQAGGDLPSTSWVDTWARFAK
jgi:hypothetical protein